MCFNVLLLILEIVVFGDVLVDRRQMLISCAGIDPRGLSAKRIPCMCR